MNCIDLTLMSNCTSEIIEQSVSSKVHQCITTAYWQKLAVSAEDFPKLETCSQDALVTSQKEE